MPDQLQVIADQLRRATRIAALTGAGISVESGIPTFRDAQTGLWSKYDQTQLATVGAFERNPQLVWEWYEWRRSIQRAAQPNPGHLALADLARRVPHFVLVTQNIDGLHARAGSPDVIELHGNLDRNKCAREGTLVARDQARVADDGLLKCPRCGAYLRPDVVWFGENLPRAELERAWREAQTCDAFLVIGTSALVEPAASLARVAKDHGAYLVEINPDATALSELADAAIRGKAGAVLPQLVNCMSTQEQ